MLKNAFAVVALASSFLLTPSAFSAVVLSGDIILSDPPPLSADHDALESSQHAFFWQEQQGVVVNDPFFVTIINPDGLYDSGNAATEATWGGKLSAGTYDSYYFHADKQGSNVTFNGSITFDTEIVGIIYKQTELDDTDEMFGAIGTTYSGGGSGRIYELDGANNWFSVSADGKTLNFQTVVAHNMDDMRILVSPVPVPASIWFFASALVGLMGVKRRQ